jgi:hypothetical protein
MIHRTTNAFAALEMENEYEEEYYPDIIEKVEVEALVLSSHSLHANDLNCFGHSFSCMVSEWPWRFQASQPEGNISCSYGSIAFFF